MTVTARQDSVRCTIDWAVTVTYTHHYLGTTLLFMGQSIPQDLTRCMVTRILGVRTTLGDYTGRLNRSFCVIPKMGRTRILGVRPT